MEISNKTVRPIVYDYRSPHQFFADLLAHYKSQSSFSIRQRVGKIKKCSPALISQVLSAKRRLTRDQLPTFAKLFKLNQFEYDYLDESMRMEATPKLDEKKRGDLSLVKKRETKNQILSSWYHAYVKDLVSLKGFSLESKVLYQMLYGLISPEKIEKSVHFLLKEGFWRKTEEHKIVAEDPALISTNEIPNEKIKNFHKKALKIAQRGLDLFPSHRRKASTVLISVDKDKIVELRSLIDSFQHQLLKFIEENPEGSDELVQVAIHLTPIGGKESEN